MYPAEREGGLVGRDHELKVLLAAVRRVTDGVPETVVLVGEAGIGKSRLVAELTARASGEMTVLLGGAVDSRVALPGIGAPFGPLVEAVRWAVDDWSDSGRLAAAWIDPATPAQGADPVVSRQDQLLRLLGALAQERPVLLVVEDVHWADESSLAALIHLTRHTTREPILIVVTTRPPGPGVSAHATACSHLLRSPSVTWLELAGLDDEQVDELLEPASLSSAAVAEVVRLAEGNPLVAQQLASVVQRTGTAHAVPAQVRDLTRQLWSDVHPQGRPALWLAAVLGRDLSMSLLAAAVHELPEATISGMDFGLRAGQDLGLLRPTASGIGFRHELERRAVLDLAPASWRPRLHAAAARAVEQCVPHARREPDVLARLAIHWLAAGDRPRAADTLLRAGIAATGLGAFPVALEHLAAGVDRWDDLSLYEPAWRSRIVEVALAAAEAGRWSGRLTRARNVTTTLAARLDGDDLSLVLERVGWIERERGQLEAARAAYDHATAAAETPAVRARALAGRAALEMTSFNLERAKALCEEGLTCCPPDGSGLESSLRCTLGVVTALNGDGDTGLALLADALHMAEQTESDSDVWRALGNTIFVLHTVGRWQDATHVGVTAIARARTAGILSSPVALPVVGNGMAGLLSLGRWDEAIEAAHELRVDGFDRGPSMAVILLVEAEILVCRGEVADAVERLDGVQSFCSSAALAGQLSHVHRLRAQLALDAGRSVEAREWVLRGLTDDMAAPADAVLELAILGVRLEADALTSGERAADAARLSALADIFSAARGRVDAPTAAIRQGFDSMMEGHLGRARGNDSPAPWLQAAQAWGDAGQSYQRAAALVRAVDPLLATGRREQAATALREAIRLLQQVGARPLLGAAQALARRARLRLDSNAGAVVAGSITPAAQAVGLTAREVDVLTELMQGRSNRQIARRLTISERTVGVHVSNILHKLGVSTRLAAAAAAHQRHLLGAQPDLAAGPPT